MKCAVRGDLELLKVLIDGGGDPAKVDKLSRTPLMFAAKNGHVHVVSYLLQLGVDVNAQDTSENTALHYASAYGWVTCVKLLLKTGADADSKSNWSSACPSLMTYQIDEEHRFRYAYLTAT